MFRALITMMDVPTALSLLAPRTQRLSRGGALLIFSCLLLILGPLAYLWWRFDLSATWDWFRWLIGDGSAAEAEVNSAATSAGADAETAGLVLLLFGTGFTLLPSAVQIGLSRFISVPALGFLVKVSLGFDLVTDWGPMWQMAAGNPWFETFRWWPLVGLARLVAAAIGTVLASVVIQSATILVAAGLLYLAAAIIVPQASARTTVQVIEG
jgi:hypothetical protein